MNPKICPRCNQGILYIFKSKYILKEIILCDECDAMWLKGMKITYGDQDKDFYNYEIFMNQNGVSSPWEEENIFLTPYYENEL